MMKYRLLFKNILNYSWNAFSLIILWWIPIVYIFGNHGDLMYRMGYYSLMLYDLGVILLPLPLFVLAYFANQRAKSIYTKAFIIYIFWTIIAFVTFFILSAAVGGVSMAAVENPNKWQERYFDYFVGALKGLLYFQPVVLLLAALATRRVRKM